MSRIDANITKQKRRRHSSEHSPNSILTPDHKPLRKKFNFDSDLHIDLLEMQGDNSVLLPHVSVSSENSAMAPTEKHSFDEKNLCSPTMTYSDLHWPLKISYLITCVRNSDKICICVSITPHHRYTLKFNN